MFLKKSFKFVLHHNQALRQFTNKGISKKTETFIYIMNDKHSIKPEKEMRIIHEEKKEIDITTGEEKSVLVSFSKILLKFRKIQHFRNQILSFKNSLKHNSSKKTD